MTRWEANPRERLASAALDLFAERGYDQTTVADITLRAGLTKSTFFRHFDDKREVLFGGQDDMVTSLGKAATAAAVDESPLGYVSTLLNGLAGYFPSEHRHRAATRAATIGAHPELQERELLKRAQLATAIENALRSRDLDDLSARLGATLGILALDTAYNCWVAPANQEEFADLLTQALRDLAARAGVFGEAASAAA